MPTNPTPIEEQIQSSIDPDSIIHLAMGFMASKHLFVANEIGLSVAWLREAPLSMN